MEHSLERKLELWDEISRASELQAKDDARHWHRSFFAYVGAIVAAVAIATMVANLSR